jgi:integrase
MGSSRPIRPSGSGGCCGRLIPVAAVEERPDPFTAEEIETLLGTAERDMPEWHALILTLARTGLRIGEALALQWDDGAPTGSWCAAPIRAGGSGRRRATEDGLWT